MSRPSLDLLPRLKLSTTDPAEHWEYLGPVTTIKGGSLTSKGTLRYRNTPAGHYRPHNAPAQTLPRTISYQGKPRSPLQALCLHFRPHEPGRIQSCSASFPGNPIACINPWHAHITPRDRYRPPSLEEQAGWIEEWCMTHPLGSASLFRTVFPDVSKEAIDKADISRRWRDVIKEE